MFLDITNPHTWELIGGREHEDQVKKTFMNNINEGDTIIDVGANMGEFSIIAAKKVGQKGKVISIEPLKQAVSWLEKNLTLNCFSNYEILEKAIGKNKGIMTLYQKSESSQHGMLDPDISEKKLVNTGEIIVDTIDDIISSRNITKVEMLKIDVEGFEYEVLCGCKNSFKENKIKKIICEIHSQFLKIRRLGGKRYRLGSVTGEFFGGAHQGSVGRRFHWIGTVEWHREFQFQASVANHIDKSVVNRIAQFFHCLK